MAWLLIWRGLYLMFSYVRSLCSSASVSDGAGWTVFSLMSQLRHQFHVVFKEFYFLLSPEKSVVLLLLHSTDVFLEQKSFFETFAHEEAAYCTLSEIRHCPESQIILTATFATCERYVKPVITPRCVCVSEGTEILCVRFGKRWKVTGSAILSDFLLHWAHWFTES